MYICRECVERRGVDDKLMPQYFNVALNNGPCGYCKRTTEVDWWSDQDLNKLERGHLKGRRG